MRYGEVHKTARLSSVGEQQSSALGGYLLLVIQLRLCMYHASQALSILPVVILFLPILSAAHSDLDAPLQNLFGASCSIICLLVKPLDLPLESSGLDHGLQGE